MFGSACRLLFMRTQPTSTCGSACTLGLARPNSHLQFGSSRLGLERRNQRPGCQTGPARRFPPPPPRLSRGPATRGRPSRSDAHPAFSPDQKRQPAGSTYKSNSFFDLPLSSQLQQELQCPSMVAGGKVAVPPLVPSARALTRA